MPMDDLVLVWVFVISFTVFAYVVLDGFDLGIAILFPFVAEPRDREPMVDSIAPVWDGNETWLVLGGGSLMAAFPLAYAILMPALYAPLIIMLLALIFRGVAFEFRHRDEGHKAYWDAGFVLGSYLATLAQGIVLGAFVQGIAVAGRQYAGGWFDWLTPFSIVTAIALVTGYALLGAGWLILKTEGELQARMYQLARPLACGLLGFIGVVSLWSPFLDPAIRERWFSLPHLLWFSPVPLLVAGLGYLLLAAISRRRERWIFPLSLGLFLLSFAGLAITLYPYAVPRAITVWQAAAPRATLAFLLAGVAVLIPLILAYTGYAYWVFRGKVRSGDGYG